MKILELFVEAFLDILGYLDPVPKWVSAVNLVSEVQTKS